MTHGTLAARHDAVAQNFPTTSERIIGTNEVLRKAPFGRVTLWREVKAGRFPAPARITPGKNGWRESVVDKHLAAMFNDA